MSKVPSSNNKLPNRLGTEMNPRDVNRYPAFRHGTKRDATVAFTTWTLNSFLRTKPKNRNFTVVVEEEVKVKAVTASAVN